MSRRIPQDANGTPIGSELEAFLLRHGVRDEGQLWTWEDLVFTLSEEISQVNAERMEEEREKMRADRGGDED